MNFTGSEFIKDPPRATEAIPPSLLHMYQNMNWYCQVKKNGTYSVIRVHPDGTLIARTRRGEPHKAWDWTDGSRKAFTDLPITGWTVICAELMHSKVPGIRDTHYIHDIMVLDGKYLIGEPYVARLTFLHRLFLRGKGPKVEWDKWVLDPHTWLTRNLRTNFRDTFDRLTKPEDEGIVLKSPGGMLGSREQWTVKCRRPKTNYNF